jgi:TonB family protein
MLTFLLILGISSCTLAQSQQQLLTSRVKPYIVSITAYDNAGGVMKRGFGIFVSDEGDVVADRNIIEGATRVEIRTADGQTFRLSRLIAREPDAQMVLFQARVPSGIANAVKVARTEPGLGEQVGVVIANEQHDPSITIGSTTRRKEFKRWDNLEISAPLPAGSMGNPAFNINGELVGIVVAQAEATDSFTIRAGERLSKMVEEMLATRTGDLGQKDRATDSAGAPLSTKGIRQVGPVLQGMATKRVEPVYPQSAKGLHITGTVIVRVTIDEAGNVLDAEVGQAHFQRPINVPEAEARNVIEDLKAAAVAGARKWKFTPTRLDGGPVKVIGTITFNFRM